MTGFDLAIGLVVLWGVAAGASRIARGSVRPVLATLAVLLACAAACWLIGAQKTGHASAGLLSTLAALLLLLAAGALGLGAALRALHDATRRRTPRPAPERVAGKPAGDWDMGALWALAAVAVIASLRE